jgi:hypothetical protein
MIVPVEVAREAGLFAVLLSLVMLLAVFEEPVLSGRVVPPDLLRIVLGSGSLIDDI